MHPIFQTLIAAALALAGAGLGRVCSRLPKPWWIIGYLFPLVIVAMIIVTRRVPTSVFIAPFSWFAIGRTHFALMGFAAAMLMVTPLSRLKKERERQLILTFVTVFVGYSCVYPFVSPLLVRARLQRLGNNSNADGVCLQSTNFTCGPAAAVTALRRVGIEASEGQVALWADTCPASGTPPDSLYRVLRDHYASAGLKVEYRPFDSIDQLPRGKPILAVINLSFFIDHFVVILDITDTHVIVGDPLSGRQEWKREYFESRWRKTGIVLSR